MHKKRALAQEQQRAARKANNKKLNRVALALFAFAAVCLAVVLAATGGS